MKKNSRKKITAALLLLSLLFCGCGEKESSPENSETESVSATETAFLPTNVTETDTETTEKTTEAPVYNTNAGGESPEYPIFDTLPANQTGIRIFLGESRTVGMRRSMGGNSDTDIFIAEGGVCYTWFRDTGFSELAKYLDSGQVSDVFFNVGINDVADCVNGWKDYDAMTWVKVINDMVFAYQDIRFYFVSIGPVSGNYHGNRIITPGELNPAIDKFNVTMYERCYARYIDVNGYLYETGFDAPDGVHYSGDTNRKIYDYILSEAAKF